MRVNEVYNNWLSDGGIFTDLNGFDVPWKNDNTAINLDMIYHGTRSGNKHISPLVKTMLQTDNTNILSATRRVQLATTIYQMFIDKWTKLYNTLSFEYDPINNYDMTETETVSGSESGTRLNTGTQSTADTGTQSTADTGTQTNDRDGTIETEHTGTQGTSETNTVTGSGSTDNTIFGFNSSTASNDSGSETSSTNTGTGSTTRTDNLTDTQTDNLTDIRTDNLLSTRTDNLLSTRTDNLSETNSGTRSESRTLTRSGNIGVTTSQQMIQSERDLDNYNVFYDGIFSDIDRVLTIATY